MMASVQSSLISSPIQTTLLLGKRPREPLAERNTNVQPKRGKPIPESHPGETKDKKASNDKPSLDEAPASENVDDESLDEPPVFDRVESEIFDLDENAEDVDQIKAQEQARQFQNWFRDCEQNDLLKDLHIEERLRRIERCEERLAFILNNLVQTANSMKMEDFSNQDLAGGIPMNFVWWVFFLKISIPKVLDRLLGSLPDAIEVILGGHLTNE